MQGIRPAKEEGPDPSGMDFIVSCLTLELNVAKIKFTLIAINASTQCWADSPISIFV